MSNFSRAELYSNESLFAHLLSIRRMTNVCNRPEQYNRRECC